MTILIYIYFAVNCFILGLAIGEDEDRSIPFIISVMLFGLPMQLICWLYPIIKRQYEKRTSI